MNVLNCETGRRPAGL